MVNMSNEQTAPIGAQPEDAALDAAPETPDAQETPAAETAKEETPAGYVVNPEKNEVIEVDGAGYRRLCIKTHVITDQDNICDVVEKYVSPLTEPGDIVFITEKAVACTQRRAIPLEEIHPLHTHPLGC
mgnify:FL=1